MKWKTKAIIQNLVSILPARMSLRVYYLLQTKLGKLESSNPLVKFGKAAKIAEFLLNNGEKIEGKIFFELGTGYRLNVPIALWLMDAKTVYTVDLNPYLQWELIEKDLKFITSNVDEIKEILGENQINEDRLNELLDAIPNFRDEKDILSLCNIHFKAPEDAAKLSLETDLVDCYFSNDVLEHIPPAIIKDILSEAKRVTKSNGLHLHLVDFTDHFSHSDKSINALNFLRYTDKEWDKYAGNRYMYMNRLRIDDIRNIILSAGHKFKSESAETDLELKKQLDSGDIPLNDRFISKNSETLSAMRAWFVSSA